MDIVSDRRALHRIPELDRTLPKTMAYLQNALACLRCQVFSPMESALCAFFDFGRDSAIAFRSDADALPIQEATGAAYASVHQGCMHACGHDGHMAILLELARRLDRKKGLPNNVLLVFQPAEETTGGAKAICETGVFAAYRVQAIFGLHLWPGLEPGRVCSRCEEMLSRSSELTVDITGRSSHIAKPWEGMDALAAGVAFYRRAIALEQSLPKNIFRLLNFGRMESGSVRNAISGFTRLEGTLRAFQENIYAQLRQGLLDIAEDIQSRYGCTVSVHLSDGYPAVINPPELYKKVAAIADFQELEAPSMITEDFSWYQQYLPGMFFFLGVGGTPALHACNFDFDEAILTKGADFFENLAENFR